MTRFNLSDWAIRNKAVECNRYRSQHAVEVAVQAA